MSLLNCVYIYIHMQSKEPEVSMIKVRYVNTSMSVCYMFIIQILSLYIIYIHIQYYTTWIIKPVGRGKKCLCLTCCKSFLRHQKNTNPRWTRHTHPNPLVHHHFPHKIWYHLGGPMIRPNICRNLIILRQSLSIWAIAQVAQVKLHKIQVVCVVCLYSLNLNIPLHI